MLQLVNPSVADRHRRREHGQSGADEAGRAAPIPGQRRTHQHRTVIYPDSSPSWSAAGWRRQAASPARRLDRSHCQFNVTYGQWPYYYLALAGERSKQAEKPSCALPILTNGPTLNEANRPSALTLGRALDPLPRNGRMDPL